MIWGWAFVWLGVSVLVFLVLWWDTKRQVNTIRRMTRDD